MLVMNVAFPHLGDSVLAGLCGFSDEAADLGINCNTNCRIGQSDEEEWLPEPLTGTVYFARYGGQVKQ
jgi:hypothetical protein